MSLSEGRKHADSDTQLLHNLYCTAAGLYPQQAITVKTLHLAKHSMIGSRSAVTLTGLAVTGNTMRVIMGKHIKMQVCVPWLGLG